MGLGRSAGGEHIVALRCQKIAECRARKGIRAKNKKLRLSRHALLRGNRSASDRVALGMEPLHDHVAEDQLGVFGDLHVVDGEMNRNVGQRPWPCRRNSPGTRSCAYRCVALPPSP